MRIILCLLLTLIAAPASAGTLTDMTKIFEDQLSGYADYIPNTVRKNGNFRQAPTLTNRTKTGPSGEMSELRWKEYDCKEKRFRFLDDAKFAGPMATGKILFFYGTPTDWVNIYPNTPIEDALKFVCAK